MPEISIIVPVYKAEKYIERCVRSILAQTFRDFELILVDDGSPDNSGYLCDRFAQEDNRVHVIHKENGGVSSARNCGLDVSSGKYIMFCDSDDYVEPKWCEWLYQSMQSNQVCLAICGVEFTFDSGKSEYRGISQTRVIPQEKFIELLSEGILYSLWNKIFISDIIKVSRLQFKSEYSHGEDAIFILEYLKRVNDKISIVCGSMPLYHYCTYTADSLTKHYVKDYWTIEKEMLFQLVYILEKIGISRNVYIKTYSTKAAWAVCGAISNILSSKNDSKISEKYRGILDIINSDESRAAFEYEGFKGVISNRYLKILNTKRPLLIMIFVHLSKIKDKLFSSTSGT